MAHRDAHGRFIKDTDHGAKALIERLRKAEAESLTLTVGVHEAEGSAEAEGGEGATVLEVATWNEFGTVDSEARSFIAAWVDENVDRIKSDMRAVAKAVVTGKIPSLEVGFDRLGLLYVAEIQARIKAGIAPENRPSTVEKKGSSTPLIDTGQLWTSILHQLKKAS